MALKMFTKGWIRRMKSEADMRFGICDGIWTPVVNTGVVVAGQLTGNSELTNKAVELSGLTGTPDLVIGAVTYVVDNGNIVIFNLSGDAVTVLGAAVAP